MAKKYAMLVKVDGSNNNNKFYEITWNDDDSVTARYGRNGDNGVTEHKGHGETAFLKVFKAKTSASKGYKQVDVLTGTDSGIPTGGVSKVTESLAEIAKRDISNNNPVMAALLDKLAKINKYELMKSTGDKIDIVDGVVRTVLGPITLSAVGEARSELIKLSKFVETEDYGDEYGSLLNQYLSIIPQAVPRKRGWDKEFFGKVSSLASQSALLDQIETSITNYKPAPVVDNGVQKEVARVFGHSLEIVEDGATIDRITKFYKDNMNRSHQCAHLKLKRIYKVSNPDTEARYKTALQRVGNEKQLWHGTRAFNVLSILKGGLIIPTSAGGYHITGRMFGDGLYFSDQSTKSLNYAYGYWGGGGREENCFMFLADVAMGKHFTPSNPIQRIPAGYDSCFAIGGRSGVQNNEMIVYSLDQANLGYLCEFDA
jgi:poly [ADP-ribose] polymerase